MIIPSTIYIQLSSWIDLVTLMLLFIAALLATYLIIFLIKAYAEHDRNLLMMFLSRFYQCLTCVHNYAYHLLREGDSEDEILKKLKSYHYPFYEWNLANKETSDAVHKVGLVLKDDGLLRKYIVKYRFKYSHYKELKKELEATDDKIRIRRALESILTEPTEVNVKKYAELISRWQTKPYIGEKVSTSRISAGENEAYVLFGLKEANVIKADVTYEQYVDHMLLLKESFPGMTVVRSKSSLSEHNEKRSADNKAYQITLKTIKEASLE